MKYALLIIAAAALFCSSCKKEPNSTLPKSYKVKYKIACSDCQVIYYKDADQNQASENNKNSSWTYNFDGKQGQEVLLFAYNTSGSPQGGDGHYRAQ